MSISPVILRVYDFVGDVVVAANVATQDEVADLRCIFGAAIGDANWKRAERAVISIEARQLERIVKKAEAEHLRAKINQGMDAKTELEVENKIKWINARAEKIQDFALPFLNELIPCINVERVAALIMNGNFDQLHAKVDEVLRIRYGTDPDKQSSMMNFLRSGEYLNERGLSLAQQLPQLFEAVRF